MALARAAGLIISPAFIPAHASERARKSTNDVRARSIERYVAAIEGRRATE
jgi:hypothetical protein